MKDILLDIHDILEEIRIELRILGVMSCSHETIPYGYITRLIQELRNSIRRIDG
ncbi:MAG: hypothetical protein Q8R28_00090 [Dehalococcoidia bacterium]|nr:hypothetical protein [Dehalococcoidia bacterium]